jgi:fructosamine-3-kinase
MQVAGIVASYPEYKHDGYGFLEDEKPTWREFLLDEIEYAEKRIPQISQERVLRALTIAGAKDPKQYLMHGDFGAHNFLNSNGVIRAIDPMPMVGDRLYDFYFAVLSNVKIFAELGRDYIMSFFEGYDLEYKEALMTIVLYVRMSRAAAYDLANLDKYITLYEGEK